MYNIHPPDIQFPNYIPRKTSRVPRLPSSTNPNTNPRLQLQKRLTTHQSMLFPPTEIHGPISSEEALRKYQNLLNS